MIMINKDRVFKYLIIITLLSIILIGVPQSCKKLELERVVRIKTGEFTNITANYASITGVIQDYGKNEITEYGHCWSLDENPTPDLLTKTKFDSIIIGEFQSNLDNLLPGNAYYIRAYALSGGETVFGDIVLFTTNAATKPTVTTALPSNISDSSATCGGNVTNDGGKPVTVRGVCWNTSENQSISDYYTTDGNGIGEFTSNISGLSLNTTYYIKAYATNDVGTGYGEELSFTTKDVITIVWEKSLGGSGHDTPYSIQKTSDGGYIIAGKTSSKSGDVSENNGGTDCWIVKLNSLGDIDWEKSLGGSSSECAYSIHQTTDGGYIMAGTSASNDGDVSVNHGSSDYWIVKLTSSGEITWQKSLGGSGNEWAYSIQQTTDEGYIVAGTSISDDNDITGNLGWFDFWIVKLTSSGAINWQRSFGGTGGDYAYSVQQTNEGGYIIAGYTSSNDGDVTEQNGDNDYWIVKLTSSGNIDWQKTLGGSSNEQSKSIQQTADGGYIIAGNSSSFDGDLTENYGYLDYWIVKLTSSGEIDWQKSFGGSHYDECFSIQQTTDEGYIIAGSSASDDVDVSENIGNRDYWIVKLTLTGELDWQKSIGGGAWDQPYSFQQTDDGGYIIAGESYSNSGDVTGNHGETDFWIIKITEN
jgi:hypothetical protein